MVRRCSGWVAADPNKLDTAIRIGTKPPSRPRAISTRTQSRAVRARLVTVHAPVVKFASCVPPSAPSNHNQCPRRSSAFKRRGDSNPLIYSDTYLGSQGKALPGLDGANRKNARKSRPPPVRHTLRRTRTLRNSSRNSPARYCLTLPNCLPTRATMDGSLALPLSATHRGISVESTRRKTKRSELQPIWVALMKFGMALTRSIPTTSSPSTLRQRKSDMKVEIEEGVTCSPRLVR